MEGQHLCQGGHAGRGRKAREMTKRGHLVHHLHSDVVEKMAKAGMSGLNSVLCLVLSLFLRAPLVSDKLSGGAMGRCIPISSSLK